MSLSRETELEQAIATLPRISLGVRPTPLEAMERLSKILGGPPLYIKRDDLTGLAFGGNKTRMLEFSLADAVNKKAEVIVTGAAVQSNYCRQMAAACARLGLALHLVMRPVRPVDRHVIEGNAFLQRLFGAQVTVLESNDMDRQREAVWAEAERLRKAGKRVYIPRQHDTVDLDAIAYAEVGLEIVRQCRALAIEPAYLYVAAMDTTQAGLVLGLSFLESPIKVRGFSPFEGDPDRTQWMADIANQAAHRLGLSITLEAADFHNDDSFVGERYGIPTPAGVEAIKLVARTEGILIDPVYTGKAMAAFLAHIRQGDLPEHEPLLFLHTGGAPALFAYRGDILKGEPSNFP